MSLKKLLLDFLYSCSHGSTPAHHDPSIQFRCKRNYSERTELKSAHPALPVVAYGEDWELVEGNERYKKNFLNKVFFIHLLFLCLTTTAKQKRFTIMLSPAGDAHDTGRTLSDGFERGVTRQFAEKLKKALEEQAGSRVILTHNAGESITQEQKANFANRLNADLYISINACPSDHAGIDTYFYQSDLFIPTINNQLALYPSYQAHFINHPKTLALAKKGLVDSEYASKYTIRSPQALPLKDLEGIMAPAFTIELHIQKTGDLLFYIKPLAKGIAHALDE